MCFLSLTPYQFIIEGFSSLLKAYSIGVAGGMGMVRMGMGGIRLGEMEGESAERNR